MEDIYGAWDVECLDNGNLLITEFSVSRVQEVTRSGHAVWSYEDLRNPYDADRLPNGNTLIADTFRGRVVEVDSSGSTVWEYSQEIRPFDVDRLPNGNTLIADVLKDRVIEVTPDGEIVWEKKNLPSVHDADRLPNGNTLITLRTLNRVIEIDPSGARSSASATSTHPPTRIDFRTGTSSSPRTTWCASSIAPGTRLEEADDVGRGSESLLRLLLQGAAHLGWWPDVDRVGPQPLDRRVVAVLEGIAVQVQRLQPGRGARLLQRE